MNSNIQLLTISFC